MSRNKPQVERTDRPTNQQAVKFDLLLPMLESFLVEMRELSKKKQDGSLNTMKVKMINRVLTDIKSILSTDPSAEYLNLLDEEMLPQNSDAVLVLGQFLAAMKQFRARHHGQETVSSYSRWFTQENPGESYRF